MWWSVNPNHRELSMLVLSLSLVALVGGQMRPFYNIAHMTNSIKEVDYYLEKGANAIEADVTFAENGTATHIFHGYPCDCFRHCSENERIGEYLEYIRDITTPANGNFKWQLALLFLDLKTSQLSHNTKAIAGQDLADKLIQHLFDNGVVKTRIKVLLSVGHSFDYDFVLGFSNELESRKLEHLNDLIGWDVGLNDPLFVIEHMWKRVDVVKNIWQGDGRTNCLSPFYNLGRLASAIKKRDEYNAMKPDPYIDKVYHWTIDLTVNLRASLRTNVDGIITNHPERLVNVLREKEFAKKFRLATQDDNPWERIRPRSDEIPSPTHPNAPAIGIRIINGVGDVFNSFTKFVKDFVYLRAPSSGSNKQTIIKARQLSEKLELLDLVVNYIRVLTVERLKYLEQNNTKHVK